MEHVQVLERLLSRAKQMQKEQTVIAESYRNLYLSGHGENVLEEGVLHGIDRIVKLIERELNSTILDNQED